MAILLAGILLLSVLLAGCGQSAKPAAGPASDQGTKAQGAGQIANGEKVTLTLFGAGTLANPFKQAFKAFQEKYPNVSVESQFGGSVKMVKQVTELGQPADLVAVADYSVIPKYMFGEGGKKKYADWYIGFVNNAITFVYTDKSKGAGRLTPDNWYDVLAAPGVQIGRSNPDTDPSGYQTLQMLSLAEQYYKKPGLAKAILANAPAKNIRDTETELISALEAGQIDYLAIYRSDALQHHFKYIDLPAEINLSDARQAAFYAGGVAETKNGTLKGKPIVYAITIPDGAAHRDWAIRFLQFLLGPDGQSIMKANGFGLVSPGYAYNADRVPAELKPLVKAWPQSGQ